jgi:transposase-like protein
MSEFKWRHFSGEIILQCVRWYCKYGISYRDLEEMMADLEWDEKERGSYYGPHGHKSSSS